MSPETNRADWHYFDGVEVRGPVSADELMALFASGAVPPDVMVANESAPEWRAANEVFEEFRAVSGVAQKHSLGGLDADQAALLSYFNRPLKKVLGTLNQIAGTEKLEGFSVREMFSETFKHRTAQEIEEYLAVGTARTTPSLSEIPNGWPRPWLFARCLLLLGLTYGGFVFAYQSFDNQYLVPGLILMGSFAVPISMIVLFFELNTPRNVSLYRLIVSVAVGGFAALLISMVGVAVGRASWFGTSSDGAIEELAKLGALVLIGRGSRYIYILNGMLLGGAVGASFAAFESAGYALDAGLEGGRSAMLQTIALRGLIAPAMHAAWTAMVGAALWRAKREHPNTLSALLSPGFYRVLALAMVLHTAWNYSADRFFYSISIVLGIAAWFVISGLVQQGLRQVRAEQLVATSC